MPLRSCTSWWLKDKKYLGDRKEGGGENRRSWRINKAPAGNSCAGGHENEFVLNLLNIPLALFETTIWTWLEEYVLISEYIAF